MARGVQSARTAPVASRGKAGGYGKSAARGRVAPQIDAAAPWRLAVTVVLGVLVGLAPGFRGLYFVPQQMPVVIIACVLAGCVWALRSQADGRLFRMPVDWAALALAGVYLLCTFVAVHPEGAVLAWLGRCLFFLVFWSAGELALRWRPGREALLHGVLLGGATVAVTGLLGAAGLLASHSWYLGGRIYTSVQYPDAAAALLAAALLLAQGLRAGATAAWRRIAYGVLSATYLFVFVFALSRGATVIFVPALLVFVTTVGRRHLADAVAGLLVAAAAFGAGAVPYLHVLKAATAAGKAPGLHATGEAVALAWGVALVLGLVWEGLRALPDRSRPGAMAAVGVVAAVAAAGAVLKMHLLSSVFGHFGHFSLADYDAWSRIRWSEDAFRMFLQRPVLGWGGGGWEAAYRAFQSYDYSSTQVHDGWMQTAVAGGAIGLLCWVALWVLVVWCGAAALRRVEANRRPVVAGLLAGVVMIVGHGLLDFTLSLWGISMALWMMAGLLRAEYAELRTAVPPPTGRRRWTPAVPTGGLWQGAGFYVGILAVAVIALLELSGVHQVAAAQQAAAQTGQTASAITVLDAAAGTAPWSADIYVTRAAAEASQGDSEQAAAQQIAQTQQGQALQQVQQTQEAQDLQKAQTDFGAANADYLHALALDRYDAAFRTAYGRFMESTGQAAAAVAQFRLAVTDAPYDHTTYETLANGLINAAAGSLNGKDTAGARTWLQQVGPLAGEVAARYAAIPTPARPQSTFPKTDNGVELSVGEADAILGQYSAAQAVLGPLAAPGSGVDDQLGAEINLWLGLAEHKSGGSASAAHLQAAQQLFGKIKNPSAGEDYATQKGIADGLVGAAAG